MSSINQTISTRFTAHGGNVIATMGQMSSATRGWMTNLGEASRMSDRINNQWSAIRTTLRYAIAGQAVFGLTRMVGQLRDVQQQLGLIQAIGSQPGGGLLGRSFSTQQVNRLGNDLQVAAANSMTSINDMNNAAVNFLSTVQGVREADIPGILQDIARGATLTQTPIEDLTQLVTTMNIAFGRPNTAKNIQQNVASWFALIKLAPGGIKSAPELVKAIPNVSTVFQQGLSPNVPPNVAQAQMQSLVLGSLRFGATPSTAMRGLAFFLQSLETPGTPRAAKALAGIGITPTTVRQQGIYASTIQFLQHISGRMTKQQLSAIQNIPEENLQEGMNLPGVAPTEMTFLRSSLGRIHAIRAAIVLASQLSSRGNVASLEDDLKTILQERERAGTDASDMARAWKDYSQRAQLQDMANRVNIMLLQLSQSFEGILNFFAGSIVSPITTFAQRHRKATRDVALGGAAAALAFGGFSFLRNNIGRAGMGVQALRSVSGVEADGSVEKPFFVYVLNSLGRAFPNTRPPTGGGVPPPSESERAPRGSVSRALRAGARATFVLAGLDALTEYTQGRSIFDPKTWTTTQQGKRLKPSDALPWKWHPDWGLIDPRKSSVLGMLGISPFGSSGGNQESPQEKQMRRLQLRAAQAAYSGSGRLGQITAITDAHSDVTKTGQNEITLNVNVKHPDGSTTRAKVHIPYNFKNGAFPSSQGKAQGRR